MRASKPFKVILLISVLSLMIPGYTIPSAFAPSCTDPPSNMISWWPGDGDALDRQGNNDGTLNGDATFATGLVGDAFSLDGSGDFVEVANESNFDFADSEFAVDGWFKTSESGKRQMIVTKGGFTSGFSWQVEIATSNKLVAGLFQGTGGADVIVRVSTNTLNDGEWHHFAVNFDNKDPERAILYIDGVLDNNFLLGNTARIVTISDEPVLIGARHIAAPQLFFNGLIDEVEIFDRFLTAQEIADIFNADSAGKCKEPSVIQVEIDIKPGSDPNCFNNDGKGVIPIAILGSSTFDVTQVDPLTLSLNSQTVKTKGNGDPQTNIEDVNGDGFDDLVVKIIDTDGTYEVGTGTATLIGQLFDGTQIEGTDSICITQ